MKTSSFLNKVSHAVGANITSLGVSILTTLLVPKLVGVEEYGYFQLYVFYTSYIGLLHFGWNDGILLRLGGEKYADLPKESIFSQFIVLVGQQLLAGLTIFFIALSILDEANLLYIFAMTAICAVISGPMYMLLFLLQATARIKEYARIIVIQRVLFGALILLVFLTPYISFQILVVFDLISRLIGFALALYFCREVIFLSTHKFFWPREAIRANLGGGFPLLLSAMSGSLIIGVVRFGISENWSVATFGKVSLALSLSTMVLTAIVAVGQVLFPLLRRAPVNRLPVIYASGRTILSIITLPSLLLYFILQEFISFWLPEYADSATYLGILFPLFIYQVRTSILLEPYLKTLRREKLLLLVNLIVLSLSILGVVISIYTLNSLNASLILIVALVALRALILEVLLAKEMKISFLKEFLAESVIVLVFLTSLIFFTGVWTIIIPTLSILLWFGLFQKNLQSLFRFLRE